MKKLLFISIAFFALAAPTLAQSTDFSGKWVLDLSKSKPDERSRITEQTITVKQTATDFTRETVSKRAPAAEGRMGAGGRGGFGGGDGTETLKLDGKEMTVQVDSPLGSTPMTKKAQMKDGKLHLSSVRTMNTPMGEFTVTTREEWSLSADGKTLTIKNNVESARGTITSEMVYNRN